MFNLKTIFSKCVFAVALAMSAAGASAGPTSFHVDVDTRTLAGNGLLSLAFGQSGSAGPVTASIFNLTGNTNGVTPTGDVVIGANGFTVGNTVVPDGSFADIDALFGGMFGFDIAFSGDINSNGNAFSSLFISLLDTGYGSAIANSDTGAIGFFNVAQGVNFVAINRAFISVAPLAANAVPEPGQLMLMLAALAAMTVAARRRQV